MSIEHGATLPSTLLKRRAIVYVRQSTQTQVMQNLESQRRQYDLVETARGYGFAEVDVIDDDRLAARWNALEFDANGVATNLDHEVIQPLRKFCSQTLDVRVIAGGFIPFTKSGGERLIATYDEQLLDGMTLDQLPPKPDFIFKATNLQTGRLFRFSRKRVADYLVGEIKDTSKFKVAQAVAASSAFPPILSPVKLKVKQSDWSDMGGAEFFGQSSFMQTINLTDGGVYDNLGLERIDKFGTILVCVTNAAPAANVAVPH